MPRAGALLLRARNVSGGKLAARERLSVPPLVLGTVQLGMPYGLGAARDGIGEAAAHAILDAAAAQGIRGLDTALAYGEAEARIGRWLGQRKPEPLPFLVSKFPPLAAGEGAEAVERALAQSLGHLGVAHIDLYLAHHGGDLLRPGVADALRACAAARTIGAFGASIYAAEDAQDLLDVEGLAALQLPLHLANTAAADSGLLAAAARRGVVIFARSVFLQGLLLGDPRTLDPQFAGAAPALERFEALAWRAGTTRAALALAAVRALPAVAAVVVGVDSAAQLAETLAAHEQRVERETVAAALAIGRDFPAELADPRRWQR
jgi:aryl-alcohol dehydrogenase-like predicted oxidoreductase